jgi:hypothetical protein
MLSFTAIFHENQLGSVVIALSDQLVLISGGVQCAELSAWFHELVGKKTDGRIAKSYVIGSRTPRTSPPAVEGTETRRSLFYDIRSSLTHLMLRMADDVRPVVVRAG